MRKKKTEKLTPRQRQSQQIMREKAALKKRRAIIGKLQWVFGGLALIVVAGGGFWVWKTSAISHAMESMSNGVYQFTARHGFKVDSLYLEGRNRTSMEDIDAALDVKKGTPILKLDLHELRDRLEKVESIRHAAVERSLPDTLIIRIVEREPVALWQKNGKVSLVDDNGVVMTGIDASPYNKLPLIVGEGAPKHVGELMTILALEPDLAKRFVAAVWVGERRWNIRVNGKDESTIDVKLPEKDPGVAWKKLAELHTQQQLLDRDVKVIDLRIEGRLFIKLSPDDMPVKTANAKET